MATAFTRDKPTSSAAGMHSLKKAIELAIRTQPRKIMKLFEDTAFESEELLTMTGQQEEFDDCLNEDEFFVFLRRITPHPNGILASRIFREIDYDSKGAMTFSRLMDYFQTSSWQPQKQVPKFTGFAGGHHDRWAKREHGAWR
jgi:hypothetical protein